MTAISVGIVPIGPPPERRSASAALFGALVAMIALVAVASPAAATPRPPEPPAGTVAESAAGSGLSQECPPPPRATAVFVGRVEAKDWRSVRFTVMQVRAGSLEGFAVGSLVDVDYFEDVRFLSVGERYVVGAAQDSRTRRLVSKVREPAPRFGGSQVVALDQLECPQFKDPVRTLNQDGTPVESGVLTPLYGEGRSLLQAVLLPLIWVFGVLLALTGLKALLVWLIKSVSKRRPQRAASARDRNSFTAWARPPGWR